MESHSVTCHPAGLTFPEEAVSTASLRTADNRQLQLARDTDINDTASITAVVVHFPVLHFQRRLYDVGTRGIAAVMRDTHTSSLVSAVTTRPPRPLTNHAVRTSTDRLKDRLGRPVSHPTSPRSSFGPVWARERCRISPPRFLAECCKRQLNQGSFVLLYFRLFTFSDLY